MSLKVWLPLNGDLHNQGCTPFTISSIEATPTFTAGKIGQCYQRTNSNSQLTNGLRIEDNLIDLFGSTASIAVWVKPLNTHTHYNGTILSSGNWNQKKWAFGVSQDNTKVDVLCGSYNTYINCTVPVNEWTHLVSIYDNGTCTLYKNGAYVGQLTGQKAFETDATWTGICRETYASGYFGFCGCINDLRIYDHCLSAAEVREISQGLVLHYKLDQNITVGENIMPNSLNMGLGSANPSTGTWRTAGSNSMTRSRVAINDTPEGDGYGFQNSGIQTPNDGSCYGIDNFPMEANTDYIISMWARITSGTEGYAGFNVYSCTVTGGSWTQQMKNYYVTPLPANGAWTKCWMSYKTNTATTRNIYIGITTGDTDVTTQMCNIHIEKGIINNNNIIKDSSGYNHNGILTNTAFITSNTPRYSDAIYLSKVKINCADGFPTGENPNFTISFWTKILSTITYVSYGDLIGMYDTGQGSNTFRLELCGSPASNNLMWFRGPSGQSGGGFNMNSSSSSGWFTKDTWHHIVLAGDGINKKYYCYLDGNLCQTYNGSANSWQPTGQWYLGDTAEATAYFSDLRIYCTALDADAIRQLYEVCAKIDNKQNLHTFELAEVNSGRELLNWNYTTSYGNHTTPWNSFDTNGEITLTGGVSLGSDYIKINPSGKKYYFDADISVDANNQIYIGFQRYDASKTSRSNDATMYPIAVKPSAALVHQHYHVVYDTAAAITNESSNFGYFNSNTPVDTISVRILNDWSSANNRKITIHSLSLREVSTLDNSKINKKGQTVADLFVETINTRVQKGGTIESHEFIEL